MRIRNALKAIAACFLIVFVVGSCVYLVAFDYKTVGTYRIYDKMIEDVLNEQGEVVSKRYLFEDCIAKRHELPQEIWNKVKKGDQAVFANNKLTGIIYGGQDGDNKVDGTGRALSAERAGVRYAGSEQR